MLHYRIRGRHYRAENDSKAALQGPGAPRNQTAEQSTKKARQHSTIITCESKLLFIYFMEFTEMRTPMKMRSSLFSDWLKNVLEENWDYWRN